MYGNHPGLDRSVSCPVGNRIGQFIGTSLSGIYSAGHPDRAGQIAVLGIFSGYALHGVKSFAHHDGILIGQSQHWRLYIGFHCQILHRCSGQAAVLVGYFSIPAPHALRSVFPNHRSSLAALHIFNRTDYLIAVDIDIQASSGKGFNLRYYAEIRE